jgi:hypothetical protein
MFHIHSGMTIIFLVFINHQSILDIKQVPSLIQAMNGHIHRIWENQSLSDKRVLYILHNIGLSVNRVPRNSVIVISNHVYHSSCCWGVQYTPFSDTENKLIMVY